MAISPNSEVRLLSNVPLPYDRSSTYYWTSESAQRQHFQTYTSKTIERATYIRKGTDEYLAVPYSKDSIMDINYVMYKNNAYENKWFYAFVSEIRYVNDNVSHIMIDEDSIQTWYFEQRLHPVFIERQHGTTDNTGDNRIEEPISTGPAYDAVTDVAIGFGSGTVYDTLNTYDIIFVASDTPTRVTGGTSDSNKWRRAFTTLETNGDILIYDKGFRNLASKVYSGLIYVRIPLPSAGRTIDGTFTTPQELLESFANTVINAYVEDNKVAGIVSAFMSPSYFRSNTYGNWSYSNTERMQGYTPYNHKLYTYPYNYGQLWVMNGNFRELHFEEFTNNTVQLRCECDDSPAPLPFMYPINYSGLNSDYASGIYLQQLPQIAWTSDQYLAWVANMGAEQSVNAGISLFTGGIQAASSIATGNVVGAVGGLIGAATNLLRAEANRMVVRSMPDLLHGNQSAGFTNDKGLNTFRFKHVSVRADYAKAIDDYFTMFGYAQKKIAIPNTHARSRYTYIKTSGDPAGGNIPGYALSRINALYNSGITFWADKAHFLIYDMSTYPNATL